MAAGAAVAGAMVWGITSCGSSTPATPALHYAADSLVIYGTGCILEAYKHGLAHAGWARYCATGSELTPAQLLQIKISTP